MPGRSGRVPAANVSRDMKQTRPARIAVIGNYSGRNAGDAPLLEGLLREVTGAFPDRALRFDVPTINPRFVRETYRDFDVRPVGLLPWNLSLKILGLPIIRTVLGADLVLITDAILFDRKLYDPTFNYLHTLSWVLPMGARRGVPIVPFCVSLGSLSSEAGRRCLTRVLEASSALITRDRDSAELGRELAGMEAVVAADCALSSVPAGAARVDEICRARGLFASGRPVLGFNVNAYVDAYVREAGGGIGTERFQEVVAGAVDRAISELDVDVLFVETQVMDLPMAEGVIAKIRRRDRVSMVSNRELSHNEIAGLLARVDALVAMRTHALILASAAHTPVCGIIVYPKTRGFLDQIDSGDMVIEFGGLTEENMWASISDLWERRDALRARLGRSVERERARVGDAARGLAPWLG